MTRIDYSGPLVPTQFGGFRSASPRVQGLDLVDVAAHDDVASQLEARRELAALLGPLVGQDRELADRLRLRHRLVGLVDSSLDRGVEIRVVEQLVEISGLVVLLR